jgi:hypothetical protein
MDSTQAKSLVRETFTQAFDKARYQRFIRELLNRYDDGKAGAWNHQYIKDAFKPHVERYERLGTYTAPGREKVDLLVVYLTRDTKLHTARTALRNFVAHHLKQRDEKDAALAAFVSPSEHTWRFSFVKMEYATQQDEEGKVAVSETLTPARRYSYLVGEGESCHTAQGRFLDLLENSAADPSLPQIEDAFSVEIVTKEFFEHYSKLFEWINTELEELVARNGNLRRELANKAVSTVDFAKKLLGQVVFLYFIQKKGWLGVPRGEQWGSGPRDFLRRLVNGDYGAHPNFFNDVLEPLFYDTLATDRGHEAWCNRFKCRVPFLNGGLFEPLGDYDWEKTDIMLPNKIFTNREQTKDGDVGTGVLDVFDRYNFTVNEAEPLEQDVAIDPEMLGKVFENLIEENRRKGLGTFYTPREIVHYMCQESLVQYLYAAMNPEVEQSMVRPLELQENLFSGPMPKQTVLMVPATENISKTDLEAFIRSGEQAAHYEAARMSGTVSYRPQLPTSIERNARLLDKKLRDITVCDPAIGSGAFPVGMMTEIVRARATLTPYFNADNDRTSYQFKRHAIQNCLYGVDIDLGAVEIAKLRLWLSLVVDEEDPMQIKPLPNLDFKIVAGNSLLGFSEKWLVPPTLAEIETLKTQFFECADHQQKAALKHRIDEMIARFLVETARIGYRMTFDFRLFFSEVFRERGGFDVLIGNPPYIRIQNIDAHEASILKQLYRAATGKFDIYVLFVEASFKIITKTGTICFIHPHRFLTADYGKSFKAILDTTRGLRSAILFGVEQVFETATTYTGIFSYSRGNSHIAFKQVKTKAFAAIPFQTRRYSPTGEQWLLSTEQAGSSELVVKLKGQARPLSQVFQGIYQGIVTVGDDIFVLKGKRQGSRFVGYSAAVKAEVEIEAGLVKPLVKGEHIRRYGHLASDLGIIYPHHLNKLRQTVPYTETELRSQFPLAYEYFKPFRKHLIEKKIKYKTNPEHWFSLHRAREMSLFDRPKLITPQLQNMPHFTLDEHGWYPDAGGYSLVRTDGSEDEHFLLGVLNSKVLWYFIKNTSNAYNNNYYYFKTKYLESFSLPICSPENQEPIAERVRAVLKAYRTTGPSASTKQLEADIDELVYELYGFSASEITLIEKAASW